MPPTLQLLRTLTLCLFTASLFSSCSNKDKDSGGGNPVNNSYLASVRAIGPDGVIIDSFVYDDKKRVATYGQYVTQGSAAAHVTYNFNFPSNSNMPDSYTYSYNDGASDVHTLTFDGQGRITKDTSLSGSNYVSYFVYSGNMVICHIFFGGDLSSDAFSDTLVYTDGNMTNQKVWAWDPGGNGEWEDQANLIYGHSTAANPGYKAEIANTVGPLLYEISIYNFGGWGDFISKGVINKVTGRADGLPPGGVTYTIQADATGRVSETIPNFGGPGAAGTKTVFTYY